MTKKFAVGKSFSPPHTAARRQTLLVLTFLVFAGSAHATPIVDLSFDSKELSSGKTNLVAPTTAAPAKAASKVSGSEVRGDDIATSLDARICEFSGTCYATIQVPEPQSLIMVGSGLLTMAGLVRRKLRLDRRHGRD
jgi:hypothetical protein